MFALVSAYYMSGTLLGLFSHKIIATTPCGVPEIACLTLQVHSFPFSTCCLLCHGRLACMNCVNGAPVPSGCQESSRKRLGSGRGRRTGQLFSWLFHAFFQPAKLTAVPVMFIDDAVLVAPAAVGQVFPYAPFEETFATFTTDSPIVTA